MMQLQSVAGRRVSANTAQPVPAGLPQLANALVVVQRDWNGWRKAMTPLTALEGIHWRQPPGAPRPLIHAYVSCAALISGNVPHECGDGSPHRLLVCVLKSHTAPPVFDELARRASLTEGLTRQS